MRQTYEAMIAAHLAIGAAGIPAPIAPTASASLASAELGSLALAMSTPAKRDDERRGV